MKISPTIRASQELLGVNQDATGADLKKAYHKLALLYHPDRNPSSEAASEFRRVTDAYELLTDPLRVAELNRRYMTEKLHAKVVEGFDVTFGSFFGYRHFSAKPKSASAGKTLLTGKDSGPRHKLADTETDFWAPVEENNSILDHPAFDAIEVVYAGSFSKSDEEAVKGEVDGRKLVHLPWVVLNNQGLLKFLDGDLRKSAKCYRELCERIPNNIIFMYRYGLCLILDAFQDPRRTLFGTKKPDRIKIEKGLALLEACVKLGEERPVGRQKCLVIRKIIADVKERIGQSSGAKKLWRSILNLDPSSIEANFKINGQEAAEKLLKKRLNLIEATKVSKQLLLARGPKR
jgi:curved DNA-binding protein CbpA